MMQLSELSQVVGGSKTGMDVSFSSVSTDTRTLKSGELFIALEGERFDGSQFVSQAKQQGAVAAVVNKTLVDEMPLVVVDDTRIALGNLARTWRQRINPLVIGVTGSNGKTTTKELVAAILGVRDSVLYTQGNLNNDIGVPLTLLRLTEEHRFAVVEMGANHAGEIAYTSRIAEPEIAVITNAGPAHLEGFGTVEGVARAKGEMIESVPENGTVILNADDQFFGLWKEMANRRKVISFGFSSQADIRAELSSVRTRSKEFGTCFDVDYLTARYSFSTNLAGKHNISNCLAAAGAGIAAGMSMDQILVGLSLVRPVSGRLRPVRGIAGATIVDDSYNANPSSFQAALEVLTGFPGKHWLILGTFAELGQQSARFHEELGQQAKSAGIESLFAVGPDTRKAVDAFGEAGIYFEDQADLIGAVKKLIDKDVVVLVKGSRSQHMDLIVAALSERVAEQ